MKRCLPCRAKHDKCTHQLGKRILVIPDLQIKPGVPLDHLDWISRYIEAKRPDHVVCIGDAADLPSLSSYDFGKKTFEGRRLKKDLESVHGGMARLTAFRSKCPGYHPTMDLTLGNHCDRITRAIENDPKLEGIISLDDLKFEEFGWTVHPFLKVIEIEGIKFAHYFTSGPMGRPVSSAAVLLRMWGSAVMGHVQSVDLAVHPKSGEIAMFVGTCYLQDEHYLGYQGNSCRRQIVMLNEAREGIYDPMFISLRYLRNRYGK